MKWTSRNAVALNSGRIIRICLVLASALLSLGVPTQAKALTCSATVTNVDFGGPNLLSSSPTDTLATITIMCTALPAGEVVQMCPSIGDGTGGASGQTRYMKGAGHNESLAYGLYQDASHIVPWGSVTNPQLGTVPPITLSSATGTATVTRTLYARLLGQQAVSPADHYRSGFEGEKAPFTWAPFLSAPTNSCTGFIGTHVTHPVFDVIASPGPSCSLTTTDLSFPATGTLTNGVSGQATIGVLCTSHAPYSISLGNGQNGTSPTARKMKSPSGETVTYGLFRDNAHALPWGSSASGQAISGVGIGSSEGFTVYGFVPAQTTPSSGTYSDQIVVTVTY
jgi:spore coat protein U-like protein